MPKVRNQSRAELLAGVDRLRDRIRHLEQVIADQQRKRN